MSFHLLSFAGTKSCGIPQIRPFFYHKSDIPEKSFCSEPFHYFRPQDSPFFGRVQRKLPDIIPKGIFGRSFEKFDKYTVYGIPMYSFSDEDSKGSFVWSIFLFVFDQKWNNASIRAGHIKWKNFNFILWVNLIQGWDKVCIQENILCTKEQSTMII